METVKGYVEHIVFRNEDNGYTVFNLNNDDGDLTCVGIMRSKHRKICFRLNAIWDQGRSKGLVHLLPAGL